MRIMSPRRIAVTSGPSAHANGARASVADADALHAALAAAAASKSPVVIVGGGYIGLEVAAAAVGWGVTPTLVCPEDRVLARQGPLPGAGLSTPASTTEPRLPGPGALPLASLRSA